MFIKKNHHYVWQYYLRPWVANEDNKVWCFDKVMEEIYPAPTKTTACQRLFYKIEELNEEESQLLNAFIEKNPSPQIRQEIKLFVLVSQAPFLRKRILERAGKWTTQEENKFKTIISNLEEDYQANIESTFIPYLDKCYSLDLSFTKDYDSCWEFASCIWTQYMRTKKVRDSLGNKFTLHKEEIVKTYGEKYQDVDFLKIFQYQKYTWAYQLSHNFANPKTGDRLHLLNNISDSDFITSDQPVFNINAVLTPGEFQEKDMDLFYPISPQIAIRILHDAEGKDHRIITIDKSREIEQFNDLIFEQSHRFVYGKSEPSLLRYKKE